MKPGRWGVTDPTSRHVLLDILIDHEDATEALTVAEITRRTLGRYHAASVNQMLCALRSDGLVDRRKQSYAWYWWRTEEPVPLSFTPTSQKNRRTEDQCSTDFAALTRAYGMGSLPTGPVCASRVHRLR